MIRSLLLLVLRSLCRLLFRVEIKGTMSSGLAAERLLVVANHESFLDGLLLGLFLPVDPVFVVHTAIANNRSSASCSRWSIIWPSIRPARWR